MPGPRFFLFFCFVLSCLLVQPGTSRCTDWTAFYFSSWPLVQYIVMRRWIQGKCCVPVCPDWTKEPRTRCRSFPIKSAQSTFHF